MLYSLPVQLLVAATCVLASPLDIFKRKEIRDITPHAKAIPDGIDGVLMEAFQPSLNMEDPDVCYPFAAVDDSGNTNAGYPVHNHHSADGCRDFKDAGQTYTRRHRGTTSAYNGMDALMYSWYFPRLTGIDNDHTHDWQTVIVWFNGTGDKLENYSISHYSRSTRSGYRSSTPDQLYADLQQIVRYMPNGLAFFLPSSREEAQSKVNRPSSKISPLLLAWESLSSPQQNALDNEKNFGGYVAPFAGDESNPKASFNVHLGASWDQAFKSGPRLSADVA